MLIEFVKVLTYCYKLGKIGPGTFEASGICSQADSTSPYFNNYFIIPIDSEDIRFNSGIQPVNVSDGKVNLFPNPVLQNLVISASFKMDKVNVIDIMGRNMESVMPGENEYRMDLSQLKPGVYIIRIDNGKNSILSKNYQEQIV